MKTNSIKKANSLFLVIFFLFGTFLTLNAQVQDSLTINTGSVASAIGMQTQATGNYSFASGYQSIASGIYSTAIGYQAKAVGVRSFAFGESCYSVEQGYSFGQCAKANIGQSLAIGRFVETNASGAIAFGSCTSNNIMINGKPNSLMIGFNSSEPTLFVSEAEPTVNNNGIGKVGIGTTDPKARLQIADGDVFIQDINKGIIMKSPDGSCWRGTLSNAGQLEFVKLADCENLTAKTNEGTELNLIKIYPNPSKGYFEVNCSASDCLKYNTISIFDINGNLVFSQPFTSENTRISTNGFKSGSYILKLHGRKDSFSDTVVITQ